MTSTPIKPKPQKTPQTHRPVKVIHINFQSIMNKQLEFENLISSTDPDVVIGTETWLKPEIHDNEIFRPDLGYDVFRRDREGQKGGGVVILVKRNMLASEAFDLRTNCENLWVKVQITGSRPLLIGAYYKPHEHDTESFQEFARSLDLASKLNCHTWIMGDFNLCRLDWTTLSPDDNCNYSTFYRECTDIHCI